MAGVMASIIWKGPKKRGEALLAAICPDDPEDFSVELEYDDQDVLLSIVISSEGLGQSRVAVDDILACLAAAESGLDSLE
tara:strand:- start:566 stop:805 length:240 start_codon:yes stop_codon:yes gene_type:complete